MTERSKTKQSMPLLVRGLSVLTCLAEHPHGLTLQQLHQKLGIPLGSVHRILGTLDNEEFVTRLATSKRYVLGPAARALGQSRSYQDLLVPPPPALSELGKTTGETAFLTQLVESKIVCVALVESRHRLRLFVRVGLEMPLHAAASARVILAHHEPRFVEALLAAEELEAFTPGTRRDVNHVIDRLAEIRRHGFDVCSSELDDDVWAVAAPVFDATGRVEYGVTLAAAMGRVGDPRMRAEATEQVVLAARTLSEERGWTAHVPLPKLDVLATRYERAGDDHPLIDSGGENR